MGKVQFAVVDVETTGLEHEPGMILELGILLLDVQLAEVDNFHCIVADDNAVAWLNHLDTLAAQEREHHYGIEPWSGAKLVSEMHARSGLSDEIRTANGNGHKITEALMEKQAIEFMRSHGVGKGQLAVPMTGSTINFDRRWIGAKMPELNEQFHYRNIDVSSIKGLVDIYRGDLTAKRNELNPQGLHRSIADCRDTVGELAFYIMNLLQKDN